MELDSDVKSGYGIVTELISFGDGQLISDDTTLPNYTKKHSMK